MEFAVFVPFETDECEMDEPKRESHLSRYLPHGIINQKKHKEEAMRLIEKHDSSGKPALYSVERFTRSPMLILLVMLLSLNGVLSVVRPVQRMLWLLFDFKPTGMPVETAFLAVHEGSILLNCILDVLTAIGGVLLLSRKKITGGRMLRKVERFRRTICIIGELVAIAAIGGFIWFCIHYRISLTVIGIAILIGAAVCVMIFVCCCFHKNVCAILADVNHAMRREYFSAGGGIHCGIAWQAICMTLFKLVPLLAFLTGTAFLHSVAAFVARYVPGVTEQSLIRLFGNALTGIDGMYGIECLISLIEGVSCLLCIPLYGVYIAAHDNHRAIR